MSRSTAARRPPLILSQTDAERLSDLALQREAAFPEVAGLLLAELERAVVRPDHRVPDDVVRMNAFVAYRDESHGDVRIVQLVYPEHADIAAGRISVFTPVGVGLLGLSPVRLDVGPHALGVHAFVCRKPDENHERVYRWLLERNLKMYGVSFALDAVGDIYLDALLPLSVVTPDELDRLLGSVLSYADDSFNTILELGFASSIRKEWEWRTLRGEPTHNLEAFRGWLER